MQRESYNCVYVEPNYRPRRGWGQGYVFTRVCDSVHRGGLQRTLLDQADPPRDQADPPWTRENPPSREDPPGTRENTPQQGEPPPRPGRRPPPGPGRTPPPGQADPPRDKQNPPPRRRLQHTVNERPVRILLECILV